MPPTPCQSCHSARALVIRPKNRQKLCKPCFLSTFESEIHETITEHTLFQRGERVAIGASGGKDSTVLASVLKTLNERHDYGVEFVLLSIDEGIKGYRDDSLETVKRNAAQYGMELKIVGYDELYGWTMDQVVSQVGKKGNCTYCGVFRRQALDRGAAALGIKHVVTGHNADDVAETVFMNLLRGDLPRLARATSIVTESAASDIKRSKPLKYAYEKEIVLYAHHKRLDYFSTECIYSPEAFRGSARALIKDLERLRPSAILDVVRSGEDMARMVPMEMGGAGSREVIVDVGEEVGSGGCGRQYQDGKDGAVTAGDMEEVETGLAENLASESNETEITIPQKQGQNHDRISMIPSKTRSAATIHDKNTKRRGGKKVAKQQVMGQCERCGYLSSQKICKACMLLEGLNKSRPRVEIEIGVDEEEGSSALMRQMEKVEISNG
jgi:cytoplasmic tRNA 2-thiolation protein 1